ncbi:MAG: 50S ribosomal protein L24 [Clostridiales bacterium]|nr:MAG: 50S ribosomal protein L24 [Clostridiales bacterium]
MHIKQGDTVVVITGKDKGPNPRMQTGGIVQQEASVHVSNVMIWDEKSKAPSRIRTVRKQEKKDRKPMKYRVAVKSGAVID